MVGPTALGRLALWLWQWNTLPASWDCCDTVGVMRLLCLRTPAVRMRFLLLPLLFAAFGLCIHASHQPVALNDLCLEPGLELPRLPIIADGRLTGAASLVHYKRDPSHTGSCPGAHHQPVLPTGAGWGWLQPATW